MGNATTWIMFAVIAVVMVLMFITSNKQRKKQAEEEQQKRDSLVTGTEIITIGGVVGTVVSVEENEFVMSSEGSLIRFDKRAIYQMTTPEQKRMIKEAEEEEARIKAEEEAKALGNGLEEVTKEEVTEEVTTEEVVSDKE